MEAENEVMKMEKANTVVIFHEYLNKKEEVDNRLSHFAHR